MSGARVVVIGGGYGGIAAAKALDEHADVVLVEAKDRFQHNVAALRALVDKGWPDRIFLPYDSLLANGRVLRDRAVQAEPNRVRLASGAEIEADYLILATGSSYPFPAKAAHTLHRDAVAAYDASRSNLEQAQRVLLAGAGAVGLELAGEIAAVWPDKTIVMVDPADEILPGPFDPRLRDELNRQLDQLGVTRLLGSPLKALPEIEPGVLKTFQVTTQAGVTIEAEIWFRCFGVSPQTSYLGASLAAARTPDGYIRVNQHLQVEGHDTVYAIGDVADIDMKKAAVAGREADIAATNIKAQIAGSAELATYQPGPPVMLLPLGPSGGAAQLPGRDEILTQEFVADVKGRDMMIERYRQAMNVAPEVS